MNKCPVAHCDNELANNWTTCDEHRDKGFRFIPRFREGQRVRLKPFEDQPEEFGEVLSNYDRTWYVVAVDEEGLDMHDDGLREVPEDQLEETTS